MHQKVKLQHYSYNYKIIRIIHTQHYALAIFRSTTFWEC